LVHLVVVGHSEQYFIVSLQGIHSSFVLS